ncbi:MAG: helix-hairpin-helix domain-containing protein [Chloroflexota bacterium]
MTIEVTLDLPWTYGIAGRDGRTRYVGPGRVMLSLDEAVSLGGNMGTAIYRDLDTGKKYTRETLHEAPPAFLEELRRRGVSVPETASLPGPSLVDIDGVGEDLARALADAGYETVVDVAAADPAALSETVTGVGAKTAPALVEAAQKLTEA